MNTQEQLTKEELQYYQTQNQKNDSSGSSWTGIVSVAGAIIAAVVALLSLYVNNRTAIRNQRDAQFYEALKRFGDKDSPTVRASAAGTIALQGRESVFRWQRVPGNTLPRRQKVFLYYETAVNQLITGLMLEEHPVTLTAITDAAQKLVEIDPHFVLGSIHRANLKLQRDLVELLAEFFAALGIKEDWLSISKANQAALVTAYDEDVITQIVFRHSKEFDSSFQIAVQALRLYDPQEGARSDVDGQDSNQKKDSGPQSDQESGLAGFIRRFVFWPTQDSSPPPGAGAPDEKTVAENFNRFNEARKRLAVAAGRLRANVEVYSAVLRADPFKAVHAELGTDLDEWDKNKLTKLELKNAFLVEARLPEAKLDGVNLEGAQLQLSDLTMSELRKATLRAADLQGAHLIFAKLEQADLSAARLGPFEFKDFDGESRYFKDTILSLAQLQEAEIEHASLVGVDLTDSDLQGASLRHSDLSNTKLFNASFDDQTDLEGANWWRANFFDDKEKRIYVGPLKIWSQRYNDKMPQSLEAVHRSVRYFVDSQKKDSPPNADEKVSN